MKKRIDQLERRCPRLGGPVVFSYCMAQTGEDGLPCWKTIDCWWEHFDVESYLNERIGETACRSLREKQPKPKVTNILELIELAKERNTGKS